VTHTPAGVAVEMVAECPAWALLCLLSLARAQQPDPGLGTEKQLEQEVSQDSEKEVELAVEEVERSTRTADEEGTTLWPLLEEQEELGRPQNLSASNITATSMFLTWAITSSYNHIRGYRVFYKRGTYEDIKTFDGQKPRFLLTGLVPFTQYAISIVPVGVSGGLGQASESILRTTDTTDPSAPFITNVTCYETQKIYIEWKRPKIYFKTVDYYYIYYKPDIKTEFEDVQIQANADDDQRFFLEKDSLLDVETIYCLKICAGTKSIKSAAVYKGQFSEELCVFLPRNGCEAPPSPADPAGPADQLSVGIIVGAVAALLLLLLSVLGLLVWRRYCESAYYYLDDPPKLVPPVGIPDWEGEPGPEGQRGAVARDHFAAHVTALHADSDIGFSREYDEILRYSNKSVNATHEHSSHPDNKLKNRYLNIVAYDHSRVVLAQLPGQKRNTDYINANFIDGFQKFQAYIGSQGPLDETFDSFWRMMWEQQVYVIVMITNLVERGRRKCDMYWPKEGAQDYGPISVTLVRERVMANYTVRTLKVKHTKLKKKKWVVGGERIVEQFHYTAWPDHGTPADTLPVLSFVRKSVAANPVDGGPIVVHCSAGVGRTGTYIGIDAMMKQADANQELNVFGFLKHIRSQRNHLVQTEEQYVFLHDALVEALSSGNTELQLSKVGEYIGKLAGPVSELDSTVLLDKQYSLVTSFLPSEYDHVAARKPYNVIKNREPALVPIESARVVLRAKPGVEGSDYINASWMQGYEKVKEFIVTQHPTEETRDDFWTMLWDHNAQTVVLLTPINDDLPVFWPGKQEEYDLGYFKVRFIEAREQEGHSTLDLVVSSRYDDYELKVRIIHCSGWPHNARPTHKVFSVVNLVQDWHLEYQNGPLVVVDRAGGTDAATFCALTTLRKQLSAEEAVDVYSVSKLAHNKRPGIWRSKDDYLYLYQVLESLTQLEDEQQELQLAGAGAGAILPGRRHSSTEGGTTTTTADPELKVTVARRHSLPSDGSGLSNGCVIEIHGRDVSPESTEISIPESGSTAVLVTDDLVQVSEDVCPA